MTWETFTRPLACPNCGQQGEFVYEQASGSYALGPMMFKSLTAGFSFTDTGFARTSTITCTRCNTRVFGPDRGGTSSADSSSDSKAQPDAD